MKTARSAGLPFYGIIMMLLVLMLPIQVFADAAADEISALREAADSLHSIGRTDSAAVVGQRAIELSEQSGNPTLIVGAHSSQGVYLRSLGKIDEALASYDEALKIVTSGAFRKNLDQEAIEEIASLYINLAVLNLDMQQKENASKNAVSAAEYITKSNDVELRSVIYGVAGSVLTGCGDLENAMKYQGLAYRDALASKDDEAAFRAAAYTMLIADRRGDKAEAAEWRKKCNELMPKIQSSMALLVYYQAECSICLKSEDYRGSIGWFNKILAIDGIDNLPFVKLDCYGNMHEAYAKLGNYRDAYEVLLKGYELRNELWEKEKTESLQELTVKYDAKEKELALARSEAQRMNILMWLFAAIGILLALTVIFIVYASRQKRKRMQQYIEGLENERRRMSAELHDGVCNDLLAIQMKMANGEPAAETAAIIDTCREAVRRISHELMPPEFAYASIDEVIRYLISKQRAATPAIEFDYRSSVTDARWEDVPEDTSLEIYRIVQEAVGNAVKHSGATRIEVGVDLNQRELTAVVADNGHYKFTDKKGLGIESMQRRAGAIGAIIRMETDENGGTTVKLSVKIQ